MARTRTIKRTPTTATGSIDGRRERGKANRGRIVAAMIDLIRGGDVSPTADRVAAAAGVGQRTVFRHFDDMDSLYREIQEVIEENVLPIMLRPYAAADWRDRVRETVERRSVMYEELMPFRAAGDIKRYQFEFLMFEYKRHIQLEWTALVAILPNEVVADHNGVMALHLALSFQCWRRLREDEGLDIPAALDVVRRMAEAVLLTIAEPPER